jgi:predicted nucleic acid-binding protein
VILVDTSVWIDHFRQVDNELALLLEGRQVATHPFVIGEIALGYLKPREAILTALDDLSKVAVATESEVLHLIEKHALYRSGISYVDAHLLASARLSATPIWTRDRNLRGAASKLGLAEVRT